jgi:hypothetical protein
MTDDPQIPPQIPPLQPPLPPTTTAQEDLRTAGQRRINVIWEATQAVIALLVTGTGMYTAAQLALRSDASDANKAMAITAFLLISNTVFLVIGFYFGRTNHQRVGGVGSQIEVR